jgi:glycosyltransferase involved in cell wall biosynthesis
MGMGGTQRAVKFAKYLPEHGWEPVVISVRDVHYYSHDDTLLDDIAHIPVYRTESLDPLRLFARFRKEVRKNAATSDRKSILVKLNEFISGWFFIPDNKLLWLPFAVYQALKLIRAERIKVVYTTSPPHSAHLAGLILALLARVRWIADFRDAWTGGESQPSPTLLHSTVNRMLEKIVLKRAHHVIGMCHHLTEALQLNSASPASKFTTIMNGYDAEDFRDVMHGELNDTFTITHLGSISRVSNPEPFLRSFRMLLDEHPELEGTIQVSFYGIDIFRILSDSVRKYQLEHIINPIRYLSHRESLDKMMRSHLLLMTIIKRTGEEIISGKIFEYLGSGKPVLMVTSDDGYVSKLIGKLGRGTVHRNDDLSDIKNGILKAYEAYRRNKALQHDPLSLPQFDRKNLAFELAQVLNKTVM